MNTNERQSALSVAAEIISLVKATPVGGAQGDSATPVMHGAYLRALRRFERIREVSASGAGEEAVILTRSLLSLAARAVWVDQPTANADRRARWERYAKRHLMDRIETFEGLKAHGFEVDQDVIDFDRDQLETVAHAERFPTDRQLLDELGLSVWYHRLYRLSSDYAHFSLGVAVNELHDTEAVTFERDDSELAHEAVSIAVLIYGLFLQRSERTVRHGLAPRVLEITKSSPAFGGPS